MLIINKVFNRFIGNWNKDYFVRIFKQLLIISLCIITHNSYAVEKELDKETTVFNQTFSWQAMAGIPVDYTQNPLKNVKQEGIVDHLSILLMVDLYYKGFFIQSNHRRSSGVQEGAEVGYQLHVEDDWELDILTKSYIPGYYSALLIEKKEENIPTLAGLDEREIGSAVALRYSHYKDDSIMSIDFANFTHWSATDGWLLDFYYNDLIIYKNWDIYVSGGITFYSDDVTDYYYGVKQDEVTNARSYYKPNESFKGTFEIYARYPISQKWSFNAGITHTYYSNVIGRSPLVDKQHISRLLLGVFYVF